MQSISVGAGTGCIAVDYLVEKLREFRGSARSRSVSKHRRRRPKYIWTTYYNLPHPTYLASVYYLCLLLACSQIIIIIIIIFWSS